MAALLKVMIVDDSTVSRHLLTTVLEGMADVQVVGSAPSGSIALKKIPQLQPDVILQDIEMPEMSGVEVLKSVRASFPLVAVVLVSGVNSRSADIVVEGLSNGAADFIAKPEGASLEENLNRMRRELAAVFMAVRARSLLRPAMQEPGTAAPAAAVSRPQVARRAGRISLVAIGVSTGGPQALAEVIPLLPPALHVPVLIVQHMPPVFTASLARSLDRHSRLRVHEAVEGEPIVRGKVYLAPGGLHMTLRRAPEGAGEWVIALKDGPPVNSCKPAVDILFQSIAEESGARTLAVVMTGMGQDGLLGVESIKRAGGLCLTQTRETCVVYGMPQAVDQAGLSDESVPLSQLAERIAVLAS
jgi:two-component system chemotaxis response regulator CheB